MCLNILTKEKSMHAHSNKYLLKRFLLLMQSVVWNRLKLHNRTPEMNQNSNKTFTFINVTFHKAIKTAFLVVSEAY